MIPRLSDILRPVSQTLLKQVIVGELADQSTSLPSLYYICNVGF